MIRPSFETFAPDSQVFNYSKRLRICNFKFNFSRVRRAEIRQMPSNQFGAVFVPLHRAARLNEMAWSSCWSVKGLPRNATAPARNARRRDSWSS